jgi:hypothetical protein
LDFGLALEGISEKPDNLSERQSKIQNLKWERYGHYDRLLSPEKSRLLVYATEEAPAILTGEVLAGYGFSVLL